MDTQNKILLSTAYLPSVEYFTYLIQDVPVYIEKTETYPKQTYRNRCEIYSEKGKTSLSIPINKPNGNRSLISEVKVHNIERWQINHWRAIESAYLPSPYFIYYRDDIEPYFKTKQDNLFEFNLNLIKTFCELIGISPEIKTTTTFVKEPEGKTDLRLAMNPKKPNSILSFPEYIQVFSDRHGFIPNLSIIDVLFNLGPETLSYLKSVVQSQNP